MLKFTVRKTFPSIISEETTWSPFEIIRLIVSLTFNSIKLDGSQILREYLDHEQLKNKVVDTAEALALNFGMKAP